MALSPQEAAAGAMRAAAAAGVAAGATRAEAEAGVAAVVGGCITWVVAAAICMPRAAIAGHTCRR